MSGNPCVLLSVQSVPLGPGLQFCGQEVSSCILKASHTIAVIALLLGNYWALFGQTRILTQNDFVALSYGLH